MSHQGEGSGRTPSTLMSVHRRRGVPPCRALVIRVIPWLSSEARSAPAPLPSPRKKVSRSTAVWRFNLS